MTTYRSFARILTTAVAAIICMLIPAASHSAAPKAPTARQILDRTATELGKARNITAPFTLTANGQTVNGTLKMAGDKFLLTLPQAKIWYDGRTQWSLDSSTKEVNVTEPLPDELAQVNPMVIISILHKASTTQLLKGNASSYSLRLTPSPNRHLAFTSAVLDINKKTYMPSHIVLTLDSGQTVTLKTGQINRTTNHPAATFVFNKRDYPGFAIIDLR